jgi:hypothetical protein
MLFVEHTRSIQHGLARAQDALTPVWKKLAGGCHSEPAGRHADRGRRLCGDGTSARLAERWTLLPVYRGIAINPA